MSDLIFPLLSIVMPVYNEERFIGQTLQQLLEQEYPQERFEILVVDGMSDDNTRAIVLALSQQHGNIHLLQNPSRRSSTGRNIGFKASKGDYFVVVDGHCFIPDSKLLQNIALAFKKSGADCLGRPQPLDPPGLTTFQSAVAFARKSRIGHGGDSLIYGDFEGFTSPVSNGAVYAKHVFQTVGYVDEDFDACEDVEFNYRVKDAGLKCYTSPKLAIKYYPRESLPGFLRQMMRYGEGRRRLIRKHPEALTLNQLIPAAFVLGLMALLVLSVLSVFIEISTPLVLISIPYALYGILLIGGSFKAMYCTEIRQGVLVPVILFAIHLGLGLGFIREANWMILCWISRNWKFWIFDRKYSSEVNGLQRDPLNFISEEKVAILKRHLVDKVAVSDLCDQYLIHQTVFHRWKNEFFQNGASAFDRNTPRQESNKTYHIKLLEEKLQHKEEALAELMTEHARIKTILGRFEGQLTTP